MSASRKILIPLATTLAASLLVTGCGNGSVDKAGGTPKAKPVTLTMVTPLAAEEMQPFLAAVQSLSGDTVRITLEPKWHLGLSDAEQASIRYVQAGKADLGGAPVRAWGGVGVRSFDALIAPFVIDTYDLQGRVLSSDLVKPMLAGTQKLGLTGLGVQPGPMRKPVGVRRDLFGPADYRGANLAIGGSEVARRTFAALGATSTPFAFQGRSLAPFDGAEQQIGSVEGNQYDAVARSITANVNLWPRPIVLFGNNSALRRLTPGQRTVLQHAAQQAVYPVLQQRQAADNESTANLCRRGKLELVLATSQQLSDLQKAAQPVLNWLHTDPITSQTLDGIRALRQQNSTSDPEQAPSCSGATAITTPRPKTPGPLDGVFIQTTTAKDLLAAGPPGSDVDPANYGTYVFVVSRERFAFTQTNGSECSFGYGTWMVHGQTVEWLFSGGGAQGSSAANKPGEFFTYGWSLFHDTLTLTKVAGRISPGNFLAKPWQRLGRTPTRSALGRRCPPPREALT